MMIKRQLLLCVLLLVVFAGQTLAQDIMRQDIVLEEFDAERHYDVYVPDSYDGTEAVPLVIAIHPVASSAAAFRALTDLNAAADEHNFIVAYPDSRGLVWDDGRSAVNFFPYYEDRGDPEFIAAMLDEIQAAYSIDSERVHVVGQGNGGSLVYRLMCEMPERFESAAVVSALLWSYQAEQCPDPIAEPVNLFILHGSDDASHTTAGRDFPANEARGTAAQRLFGLAETGQFWSEQAQCDRNPELTGHIAIYDCENGSLLIQNIPGGGHGWVRDDDAYRLNQVGVDATESVVAYFMGADVDEIESLAEADDDAGDEPPRTYNLYVPSSYDPEESMPLVMVLHGRPDNGLGIAYITEMIPFAEANDFIVVFPDGLEQGWNYTNTLPLYGDNTTDDVAFLSDLIHDLSLDLAIDSSRLYVTGFSNGGFMTQRLACTNPDQYAAFAVVGATAFYGMSDICGDTPVPIIFLHGTEDVSVSWDGNVDQRMPQVYMTLPVPNTMAYWAERNNCVGETAQLDIPQTGDSPGTQVRVVRATDCAEGSDLALYGIVGGGHNWPGHRERIRKEIEGTVNMDIDANEIIWTFFQNWTRDLDE